MMSASLAVDDPFRRQEWIDNVVTAARNSGAAIDFFEYPGNGHLFTDKSLPNEYNRANTNQLWERVLKFCSQLPNPSTHERTVPPADVGPEGRRLATSRVDVLTEPKVAIHAPERGSAL